MFVLKLLAIVAILTVGVYGIAFLEETFVSGPRRRELKRRAAQKLEQNQRQ